MFRRDSSYTRPGVRYLTTVTGDGVVKCNCPGFESHRKCWHATSLTAAWKARADLKPGFSRCAKCGIPVEKPVPGSGGTLCQTCDISEKEHALFMQESQANKEEPDWRNERYR